MLFSLSYLSILLIISVIMTSLFAEEKNTNEEQKSKVFYIGVETNRMPYIGLTHDKEIIGLLITSVHQLCKKIKIQCEFVSSNFFSILEDIKLNRLDGLLIVDQLVFPKTDKLKLTTPLCTIQPVFIHSSDLDGSIKAKDLTGKIIGVKEGSRLHFYLIEKYDHYATIKPYSLLQNGLFDLFTQHIDLLATDKAFASVNLAKATFAKHYTITSLRKKNNTTSDFFSKKDFVLTQMTLALGEENTGLYNKLDQAIRARGKTPYCSDLLVVKE